jgi:fatty-acyl-CoA synthase
MRNPAMVSILAHCWTLRVTLAAAVPTSVGAVLEVPVGESDICPIRAGFCGAASLPLAVGERFRHVTGKNLYEVYGMTEASGIIALIHPPALALSVRSAFVCHTQVVVRRLNADGALGKPAWRVKLACNLSGPTVSPGYRTGEHNRVFLPDDVLNTGDLATPMPQAGSISPAALGSDHSERSQH